MNSRSTSASPTRPSRMQIEIARQAGQGRAQLVRDGRHEAALAGFRRRAASASSRSVARASVTRSRATAACRASAGGRRSASAAASTGSRKLNPRVTSPADGIVRQAKTRSVAARAGRPGGGRRACDRRAVGARSATEIGARARRRAPRATPGSRRVEPGRRVRSRRRDRPVPWRRRRPGGRRRRRRPRHARRRRSGRAGRADSPAAAPGHRAAGEDVERAGEQPRSSWATRSAARRDCAASFDERRRRRRRRVRRPADAPGTVIHQDRWCAGPVRPGIPPNGDGATGRRYRRRDAAAVSPGGRRRSEPVDRASGGRRR